MTPERTRPPNRLATSCEKIKVGALGAFIHTDRRVMPDGSLGPVEQLSITAPRQVGSEYQEMLREITLAINRELQVKVCR